MNDQNASTMQEYYNDLGMSVTGGTLNVQLYLDTKTGLLSINHEVSGNSWLQHNDGSLICLHKQDTDPDWLGDDGEMESGDYLDWVDNIIGEYADDVA